MLAIVMILTLVACGNNANNTDAGNENMDADVVTTASLVTDADAFVNAMSKDGTWIVAALNDIELKDELVVDGEFTHREAVYRKIALYTQDEDRNVTARFTLELPKMTVKSPNLRVQSGTVKGDVYVEATGFHLVDAMIDGDVYFANKEALDTFKLDDRSEVKGKMILDETDVVTTASLVVNPNDLVKALSADGTWIVAVYHNMDLKQDIIVDGEFTHRDKVDRKLALYTQDEDRNITASFTITAPKMVVKSPMFRLQGGTFVGDVYVEAEGFQLSKTATVEGNIFFSSQEVKDSFVLEEGSTVTGTMEVQ